MGKLKPYEVYPYSLTALVDLLTAKSRADRDTVLSKSHLAYFDGYFSYLNAQSILVENDYVDRDFLEDFAGYYSRCFADYDRHCTRLHFFNTSITARMLARALRHGITSARLAEIQRGYLGFVVVKPLPETIVGRTCLRTYDDDPDRHFPVLRTYNVSLFGLDLTVDTLAFQEQDTAAAACATSALWSAFHGTGLLFQHPIPSPVTITEAGTSGVPTRDRAFPNHGLNIEQMADAIRSVGLDPYVVDVSDEEVLKTTALAYLRAGIPSILVVKLFAPDGAGFKPMGGHGVTIGGYHLRTQPPPHYQGLSGVPSKAGRVDKFYVNDDQVGPFARMVFDGTTVSDMSVSPIADYPLSMSTGFGGAGAGIRAVPLALIVPLYNKIRIPFSAIQDSVVSFHGLLNAMSGNVPSVPAVMEWDIQLVTVSRLKREILGESKDRPRTSVGIAHKELATVPLAGNSEWS